MEKNNPIQIIEPVSKEAVTIPKDIFLELNSVLVKFWKENNIRDKEVKIQLLERMTHWYKNMGTITMDDGW